MSLNLQNDPNHQCIVAAIMPCDVRTALALPLCNAKVSAGFPGPVDDEQSSLDLNTHLIKRPNATFFMRVQGHSMINAGIHDGDIIIVDRSITARQGHVVVAVVDGQLTIKRLDKEDDAWLLKAENHQYPNIGAKDAQEIQIWGVVIHVIHSLS